jgi:hypothetical protein
MRRIWLFLSRITIFATAFGVVACLVAFARRSGF